jgi:WXG100 family type VII secretion target
MSGQPGAGTHSIEVPPPHAGSPEELCRAARQLQQCSADIDAVAGSLHRTVAGLLDDGSWRGPAADAFSERAVDPICQSLSSVTGALEHAAAALRQGATALEEAQSERRQAEGMAIAAGVAVALTVVTCAISDAVAAEAAAGAAALMARAAAAAATATRSVMLAMEEAAAAIRTLSVTMRAWGPALGYAASITLPRVASGPVGAGAIGAVATASVGDTQPSDLIQAFAFDDLEAKAVGRGTVPEEEAGEDVGSASSSTVQRAVLPRVDELAAAADQIDPAGGGELTYAGRALAKHGGRPGSTFPQTRGGPGRLNADGQRIVEEILHDPGATVTTGFQPRYGHYMDIRSSRGLGIRFTTSGRFVGFLEP